MDGEMSKLNRLIQEEQKLLRLLSRGTLNAEVEESYHKAVAALRKERARLLDQGRGEQDRASE